MEIFIILGLILLNGILSMCEMAVVSSKKAKLESEERKGSKAAVSVLNLKKDPNNFLSTIQIGITLVGILTGMFSGDKFAPDVAVIIGKVPFLTNYALGISEILIVVVVTYLTLVFGELIPKRLGMSNPEKIAKIIVRPLSFLSTICKPFVWILSKSTSLFSRIFNIPDGVNKVTEEEIKAIIQEGAEEGEIQEVEQDIVSRVFNLGDRDIESIMTHRSELVWLDINDDVKTNINKIKENLYNSYLVCDDNLDNLKGVIHLKEIFGNIDKSDFNIASIVHDPLLLPDTLSVYDALEKMKKSRMRTSIVVDEFGSILGIITLKDIIEALVGSMPAEGEEQEIITSEDGSVHIDGQCSFYDFLAHFDADDLYENNNYVTISGLILDKLEHIPNVGEKLTWMGFELEIAIMDGARIDKIIVKKINE